MADPILVSTAEELRTAYNTTAKDKDTTIKVNSDIDFNVGKYSDWEYNFFSAPLSSSTPTTYTTTLDGSWVDSQGNTQNRTISNIFLYPNSCLFYSGSYLSNALICKNLTFEVVSNAGAILSTDQKCTFENCIFNVRLYSHKYNQFYGETTDRVSGFLQFKNCVFNFYISSCKSNDIALFNISIGNSGSTVYPIIIKSCIFKIRNASDKFITLVSGAGGGYKVPSKIYNSAIFYNDVGAVQPPYSTTKDNGGYISNCNHITNSTNVIADRIMNTYIASFDYYPLPAGFVKPIIIAFNYNDSSGTKIPDIINTSFYDGSKIDVRMNKGGYTIDPIDNYTGFCTKLTTEQCKDPAKLSEIGYMFSEET